jgi:protein-tyrosine-phosphatase
MAEALTRIHGKGVVSAWSIGARPSGKVNEHAIAAMKEIGYDLSRHWSKSLDDVPDIEYDLVVTMGCGVECPYVHARERQDWGIPDPQDSEPEQFRAVRDVIEQKVLALVERIGIPHKLDVL